jgi:hypothetical protein
MAADVVQLGEWDPASLVAASEWKAFRSAFVLGPRGSGKTALVSSWLHLLQRRTASRGSFDAIFVYSINKHTLAAYKPHLGRFLLEDEAGAALNLIDWSARGPDHVRSVLAAQEARVASGKKLLRVLLILDDCVSATTRAGDGGSVIELLATQGRHSGVAFWLVSQTLSSSFTPTCRRNVDLWVLFASRSGTERALVSEDIIEGAIEEEVVGLLATPASGSQPTTRRKLAALLYSEATREKGGTLVVDHRRGENRAASVLFTYRLGAAEVRRYERRVARQANRA